MFNRRRLVWEFWGRSLSGKVAVEDAGEEGRVGEGGGKDGVREGREEEVVDRLGKCGGAAGEFEDGKGLAG